MNTLQASLERWSELDVEIKIYSKDTDQLLETGIIQKFDDRHITVNQKVYKLNEVEVSGK
ncbi:hypothetical protein [Bacillus infantis]|uniref:hypothetical protein n=1 Tax=Bacillus infantis TaxID=324767 RepID=UPI003CFBA55C